MPDKPARPPRPNILLITCDQYRFPRFSYGPEHGFHEDLKNILGFQGEVGPDNAYAKFFPGLMKLRKNAVVLRNHTIAASACTPSRAVIYTGQYGTRTGVTQTDGLFKSGDSSNFPWLEVNGIPTLGTWMREAGYTTHYFGKWHVSNPAGHSLDRYGFDDWELSYPEPHGALPNNLGVFRDLGFTDSCCAFIRRKALALNYDRVYQSMSAHDPDSKGPDIADIKPWFAVASFTNPHDIATYPAVIAQALPAGDPPPTITIPPNGPTITLKNQSIFGPLTIPPEGEMSNYPAAGTMQIPLNPLGFPQDCARLPESWDETLADKPTCQHDYAYKMGLALASKTGYNVAGRLPPMAAEEKIDVAVKIALKTCIPFQLTEHPDEECRKFIQLYAWLHAVVDPHIEAVLTALEESGQADDTIVIFLTDHGECAAAHGMMLEKWHTAYQEALHVPVVVNYRPLLKDAIEKNGGSPPKMKGDVLRQCDALTSHADILPTVLGLAGVHEEERRKISAKLAENRPVPPLPGANLAPLIRGEWDPREVREPDGELRRGVLFITDDEITAPLPFLRDEHNIHSEKQFEVYKAMVQSVRSGSGGKGPVDIAPGAVRQPNHVRCVRTMEYKLARYFDPSGKEPDQWEMYDLAGDANETANLVEVRANPPKAKDRKLQPVVDDLYGLLESLERRYLS
ncbi:MAG TPA: sulfatase-like hydrolase/transferase [Rhizomicrobium sp.]|nr:sulfatase-like hydrolase/transferase [Rhizomicrobium sp.]